MSPSVENRVYPWRDNFCEHRYFFVGQCLRSGPSGVRTSAPRRTNFAMIGADRCNAFNDDVVAVRGREYHATFTGPRSRCFLLPMRRRTHPLSLSSHATRRNSMPRKQEAARKVRGGEVIGKVRAISMGDRKWTTSHLHFDVRDADRAWLEYSSDPYMTLVAGFTRRFDWRAGTREIVDDPGSRTPAIRGTRSGRYRGTLRVSPDEMPVTASGDRKRPSLVEPPPPKTCPLRML